MGTCMPPVIGLDDLDLIWMMIGNSHEFSSRQLSHVHTCTYLGIVSIIQDGPRPIELVSNSMEWHASLSVAAKGPPAAREEAWTGRGNCTLNGNQKVTRSPNLPVRILPATSRMHLTHIYFLGGCVGHGKCTISTLSNHFNPTPEHVARKDFSSMPPA